MLFLLYQIVFHNAIESEIFHNEKLRGRKFIDE